MSAVLGISALALMVACTPGTSTSGPTGAPSTATAPTPTAPPPATPQAPELSPGAPPEAAPPADETLVPTAPAFSVDSQQDPAWPEGGSGNLLPIGVRIGPNPEYDRVVIDFRGEGTPGWRVQYVDKPVAAGSGTPVDVAGEYTLELVATGIRTPEPAEYGDVPSGPLAVTGTVNVVEVRTSTLFEGQAQAFIGVSKKEGFRVFTLESPSRLVIDIQNT